MSYQIVRKINVDKENNKIIIESATNNLYPHDYQKWEFCKNEVFMDIEDKLAALFFEIINGGLQMSQINQSTRGWQYALTKYENENTASRSERYDEFDRLLRIIGKSEKERVRVIYGDRFDTFLKDAMDDINGTFFLKDGERYISKNGRYNYETGFSKLRVGGSKKAYDYKTAYIIASQFDWLKLDIVEA